LLILVPVLYCIGAALKKSKLPDKWIPLALGMCGILLSAIWVIATSELTNAQEVAYAVFTAVTQGVLAASGSVYANQLYLQSKKTGEA
jgi:multidrug transporter EmrE-like cation transporter